MNHEIKDLRQRRQSAGDQEGGLIKECTVWQHGFMVLQSGQTFGEECILIPEMDKAAQYTARVISEKAEIFAINELEIKKKLRQNPETLPQLRVFMQDKARVTYKNLKRYKMWGLVDQGYEEFYKHVFFEK